MATYHEKTPAPHASLDDLPPFVVRYIKYLENNVDLKHSTLVETGMVLRDFLRYFAYLNKCRVPPKDTNEYRDTEIVDITPDIMTGISTEELRAYLYFMKTVGKNASATLTKKLSILRKFYDYLHRMSDDLGIALQFNPVSGISFAPATRWPDKKLTVSQIRTVLSAIPNTELGQRDRAAMLMLVTTGMTLSEAIALNREDVEDKQWIRVGVSPAPERYVFLTDPTQQALRCYLSVRESPPTAPLFQPATYETKKRLSPQSLRLSLQQCGKRAGLDDAITPKSLRNCAIHILTPYAGRYGKSHIRAYMGFQDKTDPPESVGLEKDLFMQQVILSSPLGSLE